jgi:calcineurin-like phosphoesterase family protein
MTTWFSSDFHLGHKKMAEVRGFKSVEEMDISIIESCNALVKPGDDFYILGDLSFTTPGKTIDLLRELRGRLHVVRGNHDRHFKQWLFDSVFQTVSDFTEVRVEGKTVVLCHYPLAVWRNSHWGSYHLHGHSHGSLAERGKRLDVGIDVHGAPIDFAKVRAILDKRPFHKEDYHGPDMKEEE